MRAEPQAVALTLPPELLRPLVEQVARQLLAEFDAARQAVPEGRLAYSEPEAAALLGVEAHVLRDERLRGAIKASSIVGRRIRYTRADLLSYLAGRPWSKQ